MIANLGLAALWLAAALAGAHHPIDMGSRVLKKLKQAQVAV